MRMAWRSHGLRAFFGGIGLFSLMMIMGVLSQAGAARAAGLVGDSEWYGHYYYAQGGSVEFRMKLHVDADGTVTGRCEEPATFGNGPSPKLFANINAGNLM